MTLSTTRSHTISQTVPMIEFFFLCGRRCRQEYRKTRKEEGKEKPKENVLTGSEELKQLPNRQPTKVMILRNSGATRISIRAGGSTKNT
jgi:hypothetical protein